MKKIKMKIKKKNLKYLLYFIKKKKTIWKYAKLSY